MDNLTIIVPYYNGQEYIDDLVASIPVHLPILIVDDLSDKPLKVNYPNVTSYRLSEKGYFAGAVNFGIDKCQTDVLILNQDVSFSNNGWLTQLANLRESHDLIGERIVGTREDFPHGYIHGTFMFISRKLINAIGVLNSELYPLWGNTAEYQLRAGRQGYKIYPMTDIKGFEHKRVGKFGSSIKQTVKTAKKSGFDKVLINTPPEISVVTVGYGINYVKYFPELVASLFAQTFQSFEVIMVEDGAQPATTKIIKPYINGWNGIRHIQLERKPIDRDGTYTGKPSALNIGIKAAKGKIVAVIDIDDMMLPERLAKMRDELLANQDGFIYDDSYIWVNGQRKTRLTMKDYDFNELINKNHVPFGIMFWKKDWDKVAGYPEEMIYGREDWAMAVRFGVNGICGKHLAEPLYLYRRENQNRTIQNTTPQWHQRFLNQIKQLYPDVYKGRYPMGCCGKKTTTSSYSSPLNVKFVGTEGMTAVYYTGTRILSFTVYSPSGTRYRVNPKLPFLVSNQDLKWFLDSGDYAVYKEPVVKAAIVTEPIVAAEPIPELQESELQSPEIQSSALLASAEDVEIQVTETNDVAKAEEVDLDYAGILSTLTTLKNWLAETIYNYAQIEALLDYEVANANRIGGVSLLQEALNEFN